MNNEIRTVDNEMSKQDEFYLEIMQDSPFKPKRHLMFKKRSLVPEVGQEPGPYVLFTFPLVQNVESKLQFQNFKISCQNYDFETAQRQESFLVLEMENDDIKKKLRK